jgi:hypothetical protein
MLKGTSRSIVSKLKTSVWFDLIITILVGCIIFVYSLTLPSGSLKWTTASILIVLVAYSFYYVKKLIVLKQFDSSHENIRSNLERLVDTLSNYLRFYKRSYTILYPVYFCLALLFGAIEKGREEFLHSLTQPRTLLYLGGFAIFFYICGTWVTNWYLKKLYGNHLEKLKRLLSDLKSEPHIS